MSSCSRLDLDATIPLRGAFRLLAALLIVAALGCSAGDDGPDDAQSGTTEPGYLVETLIDGLPGPTQMAWHLDGPLLIALLGEGGEGSETGRIIVVDLSTPSTNGGPTVR